MARSSFPSRSWNSSDYQNVGTRMGYASPGGAAISVDFGPVVHKIEAVLKGASAEIRGKALYNTVNFVGDKALTKVRRHISHQTSAKYGYVIKHVTNTKRAHPGNFSYTIGAKDKAMPLQAFLKGGKPGDKKVVVQVWGRQRTLTKSVFLISFKTGEVVPVKRIAQRGGSHAAGGGKIKTLWGPIIPREMLRGGFETRDYLERVVPEEFPVRLEHELAQAFKRAGG